MNLKLDIPEALKPNFQRVYRRIPLELRQNTELIQNLVLFLKVGGERLARQHLEVAKNDLKLVKTEQRKERRSEAMRRTAAAAAENAQASEGDGADTKSDENDDALENDGIDNETEVGVEDALEAGDGDDTDEDIDLDN